MLRVVHETTCRPLLSLLLALGIMMLWALPTRASAVLATGEQIYARQCAECHGAEGEGVEDQYPDPLQGDRSLEDLATIIGDTMPEDDPDACTGDAVRKVAEYIYATFYSEAARARHAAPRIALSRLTARQYVETAADLIGAFTGEGKLDGQRGLKGRYFKARNFRQDKKAFERIDDQVDFDFGAESPDADKMGKEEFAIQWRGSVIAEDSGEYEFYLKTPNGARLWVNNDKEPLIDAWVQSGDTTEHHASIRLRGGRVYPIRLDYFKFKEKTASVTLEWKAPHHVREVIPKRQLSPNWFPPQLVVQTVFPPDDRSMGYELGTSVSPLWQQATTHAAIEVSNAVIQNLTTLAKCKPDAADRGERLQDFCYRLVARAFRRPLSAAEKRFFVDAHFESTGNPELAVKKTILLALTSPRFLYLGLPSAAAEDYAVAERLAFGLWDSLPDAKLLQAASQGSLRTPSQVAAQAQRMVTNRRTRTKLRDFLHQWLTIDRAEEITKDKDRFPDFDAAVLADMRTSLDLLLDDTVWGEADDFRQLLRADHWMLNDRLAKFYGVPLPPGRGFRRVSADPNRRAGILTDPLLLTFLAYHKSTSPIHRGVFIVRSLLGRSLRPPPIAVTPLDEGFRPDMTTRDRVALQTRPSNCQTCHRMINPLGFGLEQYDAVGRFRTKEKDRTIDASGSYQGVSNAAVEFVGARQLAEFLARSPEVHRWFVEQLFHNVVKQPVAAYGPDQLAPLVRSFADGGFSIRHLLVEIMRSTALTKRPRSDDPNSDRDAQRLSLTSPQRRLTVTFDVLAMDGAQGVPVYAVSSEGQQIVLPSRLGLVLDQAILQGTPLDPAWFSEGLEIISTETGTHASTWRPVYGERNQVRDDYHSLTVKLRQSRPPHLKVTIECRAYDEGIAFCYRVPAQDGMDRIRIDRERTEFRFPGDHQAWAVYSAQGTYQAVTLSQIKRGCERPLVLRKTTATDEKYVAIAEARLVDFARMKLAPLATCQNALVSELGSPADCRLPLRSPWRVIMVADSPCELLENNDLFLNLNDPCALEDTTWIKPGKVIREVTLTTAGGMACVDFAAQHGMQYVEFDAGWYGHEYDSRSDATTVTVDPKRSPGPLDLHKVIRYADECGIGIILYVNRRALEKQLEQILPLFQQWGIQGVKYGFVHVGAQQWTDWLHRAVRKAAEHELMVDVHDEYRPTGYSRTYPNLMTQEGIGGDETSPTNEQTLMTLFTRMLCGPADNTICYYDSRVDRRASHAYQLAKAVCLYSPWQFLYWYDRPPGSPGTKGGAGGQQRGIGAEPELEFYDHLPTVWDDTRVLQGAIGRYAVIARRSRSDWYVGCMNSGQSRELKLSLHFLDGERDYTAYVYRDDPKVKTRTHVRIDRLDVDKKTVLDVHLAPRGGEAIRIVPVDQAASRID